MISGQKNSALKWKIESLEKENKDLKGLVKTYRTMIVRVGEAETSILNEHSKSYESDENNTTLAQADNTASSKRIQTLNQLDLTFFDRLNGVFKTFSKHKSLFYTIEASIEEVCKVLDCGYARILLTNQQIKKIYQESGNEKIKAMKIALSSTEVQMIEKKEHTAVEFESLNIVDTLEGLKKSFNNEGKGISCPIYSIENPDEFIGAIQVSEPFQTSNPSKYRRKKGLIKKDEALLEAFSRIISVLVDIHRRDWCMKETEKKLGIYNESSKLIARV